MPDSVQEFFDGQAAEYHGRRAGMQHIHRAAAARIESQLGGSVLSVGGLWNRADLSSGRFRVTVVDVSRAMLEHCRDREVAHLQADARALPLRSSSFDHAVLPLLLHHVAGNSAAEARLNVARVFAEVRRVLRPGGGLFVSEFCVASLVYAAELVAVPITRRLLALASAPLVVMHSRRFYVRALAAAGFGAITYQRLDSADARATDWITPIIGLPGLKIPRALYPSSPTLITARAPR